MPHYFFHLRTTDAIERDEEGLWFPSLDQAREDARASLFEMLADAAVARGKTNLLGIDITDGRGTIFAAVNVADIT